MQKLKWTFCVCSLAMKPTRRQFLAATALSSQALTFSAQRRISRKPHHTQTMELSGPWAFRLDPENAGLDEKWYRQQPSAPWEAVSVPHSWQVNPQTSEYFGVAWYARSLYLPDHWKQGFLRIEFEAIYHSAQVWLNGRRLGEHLGKGYTTFVLDLPPANTLEPGSLLAVRVDNSFRDDMLPRNRSYDWAPDGGITRPVRLLWTPFVFIERIDVDALPDLTKAEANLYVQATIRNTSNKALNIRLRGQVFEESSSDFVVTLEPSGTQLLPSNSSQKISLPRTLISNPHLWHFDDPFLYCLCLELLVDEEPSHLETATFGIRKIEVRDTGFYLNGERVWLAGVERMAGSNPIFGMAEPSDWIEHNHRDMKKLNCVFTRVHWPQDRRVLDFCDRHGILIQLEVPAWGPQTFSDMQDEPDPQLVQNGLEQLREMIQRDRNHPCIFSWGLCNEVNGQHPPAQKFIRRLFQEARRLDPTRPLTYASHSLYQNPERDIAGEMDFIMWNEYYESWRKGTLEDLEENLLRIHRAFPNKPIVISEYGYCECRPEHSGGDPKRIEILKNHTAVFRKYPWVAAAIFFDYNDYRTHLGDKGQGPLKQRVHGVVDLFGNPKPSYGELQKELSPIASLSAERASNGLTITLETRQRLPGYTLRNYKLRCIVFAFGDLPMELIERSLPILKPGESHSDTISWKEQNPKRILIEVIRPTGYAAASLLWRP